jgi:glycosyltransferase involved in cell wall biosynthesis
VKVLIVVGEFAPFIGGIGDYADRLAHGLHRAGVDVTVLTLAGEGDGVARPFPVRREMRGFAMRDLPQAVSICSEYDVVNLQYPGVRYGRSPMVNLLPATLRRKAPRVRSVVTIHDCRTMRWRWRLRTWPMVNAAHGILHVDQDDWAYIDAWCTFGAPPHACVPIASNVEVLPRTSADRQRWRDELGIADDETAIAYFGVIYPHKGVDELLDAHATLRAQGRKVKTVIVGDFDRDEPWRAPLEKRFAGPGVVWARGATLRRVSECLHACDLAALPFHSGTSTNRSSMLATIGHGLPTVTTDGPVTPKDILSQFDVLLVPPKAPADLQRALASLMDDPAKRAWLAAGSARASQRTSWEGVARQHESFFRQVLAGKPAVAIGGAACAS